MIPIGALFAVLAAVIAIEFAGGGRWRARGLAEHLRVRD